jgi:predicted enzyme related to lactoylglutathione lyase
MARMHIANVVIDCADPERLAPFWSAATGYSRTWSNDEFIVLSPGDRGGPLLLLQRVPETKVGKNRVHVDLGASDLEAEVERLVGLGAVRGQAHDLGFVRWNVMADPDGNEFCISAPQPARTT